MDIITKKWVDDRLSCFSRAVSVEIYGDSGKTRLEVLNVPYQEYDGKMLEPEHKIWTIFHPDVITLRQMWGLMKVSLETLDTTDPKLIRVREWMDNPSRAGDFDLDAKRAIALVDNGAGTHADTAHANCISAMEHMRRGPDYRDAAIRFALSALLSIFDELPDPAVGHQWVIDNMIVMLTP